MLDMFHQMTTSSQTGETYFAVDLRSKRLKLEHGRVGKMERKILRTKSSIPPARANQLAGGNGPPVRHRAEQTSSNQGCTETFTSFCSLSTTHQLHCCNVYLTQPSNLSRSTWINFLIGRPSVSYVPVSGTSRQLLQPPFQFFTIHLNLPITTRHGNSMLEATIHVGNALLIPRRGCVLLQRYKSRDWNTLPGLTGIEKGCDFAHRKALHCAPGPPRSLASTTNQYPQRLYQVTPMVSTVAKIRAKRAELCLATERVSKCFSQQFCIVEPTVYSRQSLLYSIVNTSVNCTVFLP